MRNGGEETIQQGNSFEQIKTFINDNMQTYKLTDFEREHMRPEYKQELINK